MAAIQSLNTVADSKGAFSVGITLSEAGVYTLTAVGATSGVTHTNTVTVLAPSAGPLQTNIGLADTGADSGLLLWSIVGAGALASGAGSVVLVRRRSNEASA